MRITLVAIGLLAALLAASPAAAAKQRPFVAEHLKRPVVAVLAQVGDKSLRQRQRHAHVRVFAVRGKRGHRRAQLVGRGRTGSRGVALVALKTRRQPRVLRVVVTGGRVKGKRFRRTSRATARKLGWRPIVATPKRRAAKKRGRRAVSAAAVGSCWSAAAQTTAGFAAWLGFTGSIPNVPTLPAQCTPSSPANASAVARAAKLGPNDIFGDVIGVASFAYSLFSGQSSSATLAKIESDLNQIQAQLTTIEAMLGGLQAQVSAVNTNVTNGDITSLAGDALPTVNRIKDAGRAVNALVGAAFQIVCDPTDGCTSLKGKKSFGNTIATICDTATPACNRFYTYLYFTTRALAKADPLVAVQDLSGWALGSAASSGPDSPGIVQYSLQEQVGDGQFFQTGDAQAARLQWAYYTLYSIWAQTTYSMALSMGVGQPLPNSKSAHPPLLTPRTVVQLVGQLDKPIDELFGAFPNMPDSAVIDTNTGNSDGDPPYLFPQQVGGLASSGLFTANPAYTIDPSSVAAGAIQATNSADGFISTLQTTAAPPAVITPAAADGDTWQLLPATGTTTPPAPAVTVGYFDDFSLAGSTPTTSLPQWDSSSQAVDVSEGGIDGPLVDLYSGAAPTNGQTNGQWMTAESGIAPGVLTPQNTGYDGSTSSGVVPYYQQSGTDSSDPGLGFASCSPAATTSCLLPTWQSTALNPYAAVTSGQSYNSGSTDINTGLFDLNNGVVIANQQGNGSNLPANPGAWLNQYPNWSSAQTLRGVGFYGFLDALDGTAQGALDSSAYSDKGRPVLFYRSQTANDCFFWTGATGSNPADGTGCLSVRRTTSDVLD